VAKCRDAYSRANIGIDIAGFDVFKNDQSIRLAAAGGGATTVTGANQFWVPASLFDGTTGEISNVDNRGQNLTITAAVYAAIKVGDAFHHPWRQFRSHDYQAGHRAA
jgi:hypothetical protein